VVGFAMPYLKDDPKVVEKAIVDCKEILDVVMREGQGVALVSATPARPNRPWIAVRKRRLNSPGALFIVTAEFN
jgi:hypothetical protein